VKSQIHVDHELLAVESEHRVHAMLEVTAPDVEKGDRPPLHVALVIDRSGSMSGGKLAAAKNAARFLVERLDATDSLALVAFDHEVRLLAAAAAPDKQKLAGVIDSIPSGGTTNLSGGWLKGAEELRRVTAEGTRRVLLLTDGLANVGVTDPGRLSGMAQSMRGERISTTTIGYGDGFDEALLTAMADAGGGNSYFAAGPDDAPGIFEDEFEGLASVAAQNVSLEIRASDDVKFVGVLNEYPIVLVPGGVQVQLGDFYGSETRRIVFEMNVPNVADLGPKQIGELVLRYTSVGDTIEMHDVTIPVTVNVVDADTAAAADINTDVNDEVLLLRTAEARREAMKRADSGDFDGAAEALSSVRSAVSFAMPASSRADDLRSELDELDYSTERMRQRTYDALERKRMHYQSHRNLRSRDRKEWKNPDEEEPW
jgi:Ca-activated chloride channel family protein